MIGGKTVNAVEEDIVKINPDVHVLVIYSTENWEVDENIRLLDLSIGHFTNNIEYKNVHHLEQEDYLKRFIDETDYDTFQDKCQTYEQEKQSS